MLTNDFPVEHKSEKNYGLGVAVGSQVLAMPNTENQMTYEAYVLVLWENADSPSLHPSSELIHKIDVESYFSDNEEEEFEDDDDDLEIEEITNEDDYNEALEEERISLSPDDVGNAAEVLDFPETTIGNEQPTT